jgi:hypothetical protein
MIELFQITCEKARDFARAWPDRRLATCAGRGRLNGKHSLEAWKRQDVRKRAQSFGCRGGIESRFENVRQEGTLHFRLHSQSPEFETPNSI